MFVYRCPRTYTQIPKGTCLYAHENLHTYIEECLCVGAREPTKGRFYLGAREPTHKHQRLLG